jgi:hypothetical protein
VIFATGEFGKVVAPMSEFDPNEMVQFIEGLSLMFSAWGKSLRSSAPPR